MRLRALSGVLPPALASRPGWVPVADASAGSSVPFPRIGAQARGGLVAEDGALPSSLTKRLLLSRSLTFLSSSCAASVEVSPALSPLSSQLRERVPSCGAVGMTRIVSFTLLLETSSCSRSYPCFGICWNFWAWRLVKGVSRAVVLFFGRDYGSVLFFCVLVIFLPWVLFETHCVGEMSRFFSEKFCLFFSTQSIV